MRDSLQHVIVLIARVLLAAIFLLAGISKLADPQATLGAMQSRGMPLTHVGLPIAIIVEIGGAALLIAGLGTRIAAGVLIVFLIGATAYFHNFWTYPPEQAREQMNHFLSNLALMGGLLLLIAYGPGRFSLDALCCKRCCRPRTAPGPDLPVKE